MFSFTKFANVVGWITAVAFLAMGPLALVGGAVVFLFGVGVWSLGRKD